MQRHFSVSARTAGATRRGARGECAQKKRSKRWILIVSRAPTLCGSFCVSVAATALSSPGDGLVGHRHPAAEKVLGSDLPTRPTAEPRSSHHARQTQNFCLGHAEPLSPAIWARRARSRAQIRDPPIFRGALTLLRSPEQGRSAAAALPVRTPATAQLATALSHDSLIQ